MCDVCVGVVVQENERERERWGRTIVVKNKNKPLKICSICICFLDFWEGKLLVFLFGGRRGGID